MVKEIIMFGDTEIEKNIFHRYKKPIFLKYEGIDTILTLTSLIFFHIK